MNPKPGVYQHVRDQRFYLLLFTANLAARERFEKDEELIIVVDKCAGYVRRVMPARVYADNERAVWTSELFRARGHAATKGEKTCAVYVPLYTDKPGRRVSVCDALDFGEIDDQSNIVPRFTYVGDVIPARAAPAPVIAGPRPWRAEGGHVTDANGNYVCYLQDASVELVAFILNACNTAVSR